MQVPSIMPDSRHMLSEVFNDAGVFKGYFAIDAQQHASIITCVLLRII